MATLPLSGINSITLDGLAVEVVSDVTWSPAILERTTELGMDRVHGYTVEPKQAKMSFTVRDDPTVTLTSFNALTSTTVYIQMRNGKNIIGPNLWQVGELELDVKDGTIKLAFEGFNIVES